MDSMHRGRRPIRKAGMQEKNQKNGKRKWQKQGALTDTDPSGGIIAPRVNLHYFVFVFFVFFRLPFLVSCLPYWDSSSRCCASFKRMASPEASRDGDRPLAADSRPSNRLGIWKISDQAIIMPTAGSTT